MKDKSKRPLWVAATALVGAFACTGWSTWDDVFKRDTIVGTGRGWTGGDGNLSVKLPGSPDRILWLFGDSYISGWNGSTRTNAAGAYNTTIGVLTNWQSPSASNISFYEKGAAGRVDVTKNVSGNPQGYWDVSNVEPSVNASQRLLWPSTAYRQTFLDADDSNDKILIAFQSVLKAGFVAENTYIEELRDTASAPTGAGWTLNRVAVLPSAPVQWGAAFVEELDPFSGDKYVYIYGLLRNTDPMPSPPAPLSATVHGINHMVVARAPVGSVANLSTWSYLTIATGWVNAPPTVDQLKIVAQNVGALISVVPIKKDNCTITSTNTCNDRFVLVYANDFNDHFIYVRPSFSSSPTNWDDPAVGWPNTANVTARTPRLNVGSIDATVESLERLDFIFSVGDNCNSVVSSTNLADYRYCGTVDHGVAHPEISETTAGTVQRPPGVTSRITQLLASYNAYNYTTDGTVPPTDYYRPKFVQLPIAQLKPWCTGANCWAGIVDYHYPVSVSDGQKSEVAIDVRTGRGAPFKAYLKLVSGNPDLYVRFDQFPHYDSTDACHSTNGANAEESCDSWITNVPSGATTAYVGVIGHGSSSSYVLETQHEGF